MEGQAGRFFKDIVDKGAAAAEGGCPRGAGVVGDRHAIEHPAGVVAQAGGGADAQLRGARLGEQNRAFEIGNLAFCGQRNEFERVFQALAAQQGSECGIADQQRLLSFFQFADIAGKTDGTQQPAAGIGDGGLVGFVPDRPLMDKHLLDHGLAALVPHDRRVIAAVGLGHVLREEVEIGAPDQRRRASLAGGVGEGLVDGEESRFGVFQPDKEREGVQQRALVALVAADAFQRLVA